MTKITVALMLFSGSIGVCQTPAKEPDALQALLAEVHLLRQDLEAVTIASQRVQIALYSFQMQDVAVARSDQAKLSELQARIEQLDKTLEKLGVDGK